MNKKLKFQGDYLPLDVINVLVQPRRTFDNIIELANNIAENGILNPPVVIALNDYECITYLDNVNYVWKTEYKIQNLKKFKWNKKEYFFILVAGERRFRSYKILFEKGCTTCQEENHSLKYGECYKKHFSRNEVEVRICTGASPTEALYLQLSENIHMRVPPEEEAHAYKTVFLAEKHRDNKFSLTSFARKVGRSVDTIRKALKYCDLPDFIQNEVETGNLKYGLALELSRLKDIGLDENDLKFWLIRALLNKNNIAHFREIINNYLLEKNTDKQL